MNEEDRAGAALFIASALERVQIGPERVQIGPELVQIGPECVQTGLDEVGAGDRVQDAAVLRLERGSGRVWDVAMLRLERGGGRVRDAAVLRRERGRGLGQRGPRPARTDQLGRTRTAKQIEC